MPANRMDYLDFEIRISGKAGQFTDMIGNVWEWCADFYQENYYSGSPARNPSGPARGTYPVLRGGSWFNNVRFARCACRSRFFPFNLNINLGFRVAVIP